MDTQENLESVLKVLVKTDKLLSEGCKIQDICEQLGVAPDKLESWVDHLSLPPKFGDVLSSSHLLDAIFPIFRSESTNAPLEQIGSAVLIEIGDDLFALTAAHVTDDADGEGALFMPAAGGIEQMTGALSFNPVPEHGARAEDIGDMGYFHLSDNWNTKLDPSIKPLSLHDLLLTDELGTGDIFTFAGYPWRKAKSRPGKRESELVTYTGHASAPDIYERLKYNRLVNISIRMNLRKTYSTLYESHKIAPNPQGISGGAIVAWPWSLKERLDSSNLKLAAIAHTYEEKQNCMIGTRINPYMMAIVRNNPKLAVHFKGKDDIAADFGAFLAERMKALNSSNVPSAVGIAWYTSETYMKCINIFDDRDELPSTFNEWKQLAECLEQQLADQGMKVIRAEINPATFPAWCSAHGFTTIDKGARMAFGNAKAFEELKQV